MQSVCFYILWREGGRGGKEEKGNVVVWSSDLWPQALLVDVHAAS